jgi:hypothetical protein
MEPDFTGWATKAGLKCRDGRTITHTAFQDMDGLKVPLVWQHGHDDPDNVLGHALLKVKPEGVYCEGFFNDTPKGQNTKLLVSHKDIDSLSIWANDLVEKSKQVLHGVIREVSLVLSGANPGAKIDFVRVAHADGDVETLHDEAIITTGETFEHASMREGDEPILSHATVKEIYEGLGEEERAVFNYMIEEALKAGKLGTAEHSGTADDNAGTTDDKTGTTAGDKKTEGDLVHQEGSGGDMTTRSIFEKNGAGNGSPAEGDKHVLTHDAMKAIATDAVKKGSLKEALTDYALAHGITNLEALFPDPKVLNNTPEWQKRRTEWVAGVLNGTHKSPFSRVKTVWADITQEAARAKGYIKGTYKKEEWFGLQKRVTTPTTVYKKQRLDRDDVIDIVDLDVVAWMKGEMRLMLEEEIARAILIGDGREPDDEDKVKDPGAAVEGAGIRAIANESEYFATFVNVNLGATPDYNIVAEDILRASRFFKGTGTPNFYTTRVTVVEMLLTKNGFGDRRWKTRDELAAALGVGAIVEVEPMEDQEPDLLGIIVNLADYNIGADRGGEVNLFDDFDIDYNQLKYLIETRVSGALTKLKSAIVIRQVASTSVRVAPLRPVFNEDTGVVTIPSVTGVQYRNADTNAVLTAGAQTALAPGNTLEVVAVATAGNHFATSENDQWEFTRPAV